MSGAFSMTQIGAEAVKRGIDDGVKAFGAELKTKVRAATNLLRREVKANVRRQFARGRGKFVSAISGSVRGTLTNLEGRVFLRGKRAYYGIHETGGVIVPKNRGARAQRNAAGRIAQGKGRRRDTHPLLVFAVVKSGAFGGWVSVPKVTIPARPVFGPAADSKGDQAVEIVGGAFSVYQGAR